MKKLIVLVIILSTFYSGQTQVPEGWTISSYYILIDYDTDKNPLYLIFISNEETYEEKQMLIKVTQNGSFEQMISDQELNEKGDVISYRGGLAVFSKDEELFVEQNGARNKLNQMFAIISSNGFMGNSTDLRHLLSVGPKGEMLIFYDNQKDLLSTYSFTNMEATAADVNGFDYSFYEDKFYFVKPVGNTNKLIESNLDKLNDQQEVCFVPGGMNQTNYVVFEAGTKVLIKVGWAKNYIFERKTGKYRKALIGENDHAYFRGADDRLKFLNLNESQNGFEVIDVYKNEEALGQEFSSFDRVLADSQEH